MGKNRQEMRPLTQAEKTKARKLKALFEAYKDEHEPSLTKKKLAEDLGWTPSTVGFYINGKLALNYEAIYKFSRRLKFLPAEIDSRLKVDPTADNLSAQRFVQLYDQLDQDQQKLVQQLVASLSGEVLDD